MWPQALPLPAGSCEFQMCAMFHPRPLLLLLLGLLVYFWARMD